MFVKVWWFVQPFGSRTRRGAAYNSRCPGSTSLAQGPGEAQPYIGLLPRVHHQVLDFFVFVSPPTSGGRWYSGECRFQLNHTSTWLLFGVFL